MSTNSRIGIQHSDGTITSIYCHWDGHIESNGKMLLEHYNTAERINDLMFLGNLSILEASLEGPVGHSFKTPVKGYCLAYGRDRKDADNEAEKHTSIYDFNFYRQEYNYLYKDGNWFVSKGEKGRIWKSLSECLAVEPA